MSNALPYNNVQKIFVEVALIKNKKVSQGFFLYLNFFNLPSVLYALQYGLYW
jgi:hypothetical protein